MVLPSPVAADEVATGELIQFNVPRQPLDLALTQFAEQANITLLFPSDGMEELMANELVGQYSVSEGAAILLAGTGLMPKLRQQPVLNIVLDPVATKVEPDMSNRGGFGAGLLAAVLSLFGGSGVQAADSALLDEPGSALTSGAVAAEEQVIEEILVTAEKREGTLQETPVAITALTTSIVEDRNINDLRKIASIAPSMVYNMANGQAQVYMRGVGTDVQTIVSEPGVAMFVDGVYMGTASEQAATFEDVERIEVLRGPQGTLYGRNSMGGNINVITRLPGEEPEFRASLLYGDYDRVKASASGGGSLIDGVLAARVSLVRDTADGYRKNAFNGDDLDDRDIFSAAVTVVFTPSETFELILRGDWSEEDHDNPIIQYGELVPDSGLSPLFFGGSPGRPPNRPSNDLPTAYSREWNGLSATVNWDIGEVTLRSITATRDTVNDGVVDNDGTDLSFIHNAQNQESEMFSQEFNLLGTLGDNLEWIVGAYYFDQETVAMFEFDLPALQPLFEAIFGFPPGGLADPNVNFLYGERLRGGPAAMPFLDFISTQDTESLAFFLQGSYHVSDRLRLTAGVRRTDDDRTNVQTITANISLDECFGLKLQDDWQETTYKLSADFDVNESVMVYGSYAKGYKSGGFNIGSCNNPFDPETVVAYEAGLKSTLADGRLRLNLAAFSYDYEDLQVELTLETTATLENATDVQSTGFEAEFVWVPVDAVQIDGGVSFMQSEFEEFMSSDPMTPFELLDLEGNQTQRAPDVSYNVGIQYTHLFAGGADITLRYEASYKDDYYTDVFNNDFAQIDSHTLHNVRVIANVNNRWEVMAFIENATDEEVLENLVPAATVGGTIAAWAPPRLWGLQLRYTME